MPAKTNKETVKIKESSSSTPTARPRGTSSPLVPRTMRMEVLIPVPANLRHKPREPEPVLKPKAAKSDSPPNTTTQKKVIECAKSVDSDDETTHPPPRKRKARNLVESDLEEEVPQPRRRRLKRTPPSDESCSGDEVETERESLDLRHSVSHISARYHRGPVPH